MLKKTSYEETGSESMLTDGCEVNGKIFCTRIVMEDGAQFDGTIQMK